MFKLLSAHRLDGSSPSLVCEQRALAEIAGLRHSGLTSPFCERRQKWIIKSSQLKYPLPRGPCICSLFSCSVAKRVNAYHISCPLAEACPSFFASWLIAFCFWAVAFLCGIFLHLVLLRKAPDAPESSLSLSVLLLIPAVLLVSSHLHVRKISNTHRTHPVTESKCRTRAAP